jgi:hypothetical protein
MKEPEKKNSFQSAYLTFSNFQRTMVTYQNWIFDCFEAYNYEPEEPAYTWWEFSAFLNTRQTLTHPA